MKGLSFAGAFLVLMFHASSSEAGIFGRRWVQPTNQSRSNRAQPTTVYRSYSQQPTFPFSSRSDPREWKEAHRGYGIKLRGW
jgi:hypothetical protein